MRRELYCIYWLLKNNSSVHSVAVSLSSDTLVLTASSSSSSSTSSPIFFLPWERLSLIFLGCHYASFLKRSFGFLELFSNSPLSFFGRLLWGLASHLTSMRNIWSEWTRAWWSSLSWLNFERLRLPLLRSSLPPDSSEIHLIWVDSVSTIPLGIQ